MRLTYTLLLTFLLFIACVAQNSNSNIINAGVDNAANKVYAYDLGNKRDYHSSLNTNNQRDE
jgi:hypothetical protein